MKFKPYRGSAYDETSGIKIPYPRMLPEERDDGRAGVEYQFTFLRNDERIGSIGISGIKQSTYKESSRNELYTLEITNSSTFDRIFRLKMIIGNEDVKFKFVEKVSAGLIAVFTGNQDRLFSQRYTVITTREALARNGVDIPPNIRPSSDGTIILAELDLPAVSAP